jgi:hypothetical protein
MILGKNKAVDLQAGFKSDIKMSLREYYNMISALREHRLSMEYALKFKNLYKANYSQLTSNLLYGAIAPAVISSLVFLPVKRFHAGYKMVGPMFVFLYCYNIKRLCNVPLTRRLHTEILTDDSENGEYVRKTLRERTPMLWSYLSGQLYDMGYNFPEMLENSREEFPTTMITKNLF